MQVGQMLGNYKLLKILGTGGQGKVYQALDTNLDRLVAVKVLTPSLRWRKLEMTRFEREAKLASSLDHPNICTIYGFFEDESYTYIVMQYVEGKNLHELARKQPLELRTALNIILQVVEALVVSHTQGIVHRDIKARNVMVTAAGRVVVLDFGLAKLLEDENGKTDFHADEAIAESFDSDEGFAETDEENPFLTIAGIPLGTPASSAPEMALGEKTDHRADIFSTGVVLYLLLTGNYPFLAKKISQVRDKIINHEPVPVSDARGAGKPVPPQLAEIVHRALRKNPADRFQTASEMRDELTQILREIEEDWDEKISARFAAFPPENTPYYAPPRPKTLFQNPAVRVAVIVIAILILAGIGYYFYQR